MFVDQAKIYVRSGAGGKGCASFERDRSGKILRPTGGDGGRGGDVIIQTDESIQNLLHFKYNRHFRAKSGGLGGSSDKKGRDAEALVLKVPVGTLVQEVRDHFFKDLDHAGSQVIVAKGGQGGQGNTPNRTATPGQEGEEFEILLTLKLMAEVGIVGYPNAGKSTLISKITAARPKIADFPFTTLNPVLGVMDFAGQRLVIADIPGLIEGAHQGRGLGDRFLRHIERTLFLIHLVDVSVTAPEDPFQRYLNIDRELSNYHPDLILKKQIIVANKIDIPGAKDNLSGFSKKVKEKTGSDVVAISAKSGEGLENLLQEIVKQHETQTTDKAGQDHCR